MRKIILILCVAVLSATGFALRADINNDGRVDFADLAILAEEWLMSDQYGLELVINGDFAVENIDDEWTYGPPDGWFWDATYKAAISSFPEQPSTLSQPLSIVGGKSYRISLDFVMGTQLVTGYLGGRFFTATSLPMDVVAGYSDSLLRFFYDNTSNWFVYDNISVKEILTDMDSLGNPAGNRLLSAGPNTLADPAGNDLLSN